MTRPAPISVAAFLGEHPVLLARRSPDAYDGMAASSWRGEVVGQLLPDLDDPQIVIDPLYLRGPGTVDFVVTAPWDCPDIRINGQHLPPGASRRIRLHTTRFKKQPCYELRVQQAGVKSHITRFRPSTPASWRGVSFRDPPRLSAAASVGEGRSAAAGRSTARLLNDLVDRVMEADLRAAYDLCSPLLRAILPYDGFDASHRPVSERTQGLQVIDRETVGVETDHLSAWSLRLTCGTPPTPPPTSLLRWWRRPSPPPPPITQPSLAIRFEISAAPGPHGPAILHVRSDVTDWTVKPAAYSGMPLA